jgi:phosphoserine aminotransferase
MKRVHNFNARPAALPLEVLEQAQGELLDYRGERDVDPGDEPPLKGI